MNRIQQVGFANAIAAADTNNAFGKTKLLVKIIFELKKRYGRNRKTQLENFKAQNTANKTKKFSIASIISRKLIFSKMNEFPANIYLYRRIVQAKIFMDQHFADPIDLGNIADEAYFSKFHFIRLFKKIYHKTPHQYLVYVRIQKAIVFLKGGMPVADVCYATGFDSLTSFSALFKKHTGVPPSVFLKNALAEKAIIAAAPLKFIPGCFAQSNGWV